MLAISAPLPICSPAACSREPTDEGLSLATTLEAVRVCAARCSGPSTALPYARRQCRATPWRRDDMYAMRADRRDLALTNDERLPPLRARWICRGRLISCERTRAAGEVARHARQRQSLALLRVPLRK